MSAPHCNIVIRPLIIAVCQGPSIRYGTQHRLLKFYFRRGQGEEGKKYERLKKRRLEGERNWFVVTNEFKYSRKHPALGLLSNFSLAQWAQCTRRLLEQTQLGTYGTGNTQEKGKTP